MSCNLANAFSHRDARISTAIVLPGSNIANHTRLFAQMKIELGALQHVYLVSINSKDCVNFKTALNHIVKNLTEKGRVNSELAGYEEEEDLRYDKRLRYDFDIIAEWCRRLVKNDPVLNGLGNVRVVISIDDADSFDVSILTSLIKMIHSYIFHIPFKLILSVATSIEVFEEKLPRSTIRLLCGQKINARLHDGLLTIVKSTITENRGLDTILLGPTLFKSIIQRQQQSLESIDAYISSLKYAYMSHYYSNPFASIFQWRSVSSNPDAQQDDPFHYFPTEEHCEAARLLGSFREYIEKSLPSLKESTFDELINGGAITSLIRDAINNFELYKSNMLYGLDMLLAMQTALIEKGEGQDVSSIATQSLLDLYPKVLTGEIRTMKFYEDLKAAVSNCCPEVLIIILKKLDDDHRNPGHMLCEGTFSKLLQKLNHEFYPQLSNFISTIPGDYRIGSHRYPFDSRESSKRYAKVLKSITTEIFELLTELFVPYCDFFLHEAFVVDTVNLQENVFMPTHRGAIEMALSNPKHYWGNVLTNTMTNLPSTDDDLDPNDMSSMGSDPHLCIMYTLYRESSVFINIYDWYSSFESILKKPEEDDPFWERKVLAWFLQSVAELKFLGIIRDSKRKFECVEKLVWRGL